MSLTIKKIKRLVLIFTFILLLPSFIQTKCQNMLQQPGNCTKCPSTKFLYKGDCYQKIRGCQDYISDKICLSCQSGYVINQGLCIKQAIFFKLQKTDIPSVKINIQGELTYKDIDERIGDSRKGMFEQINKYFKQKYTRNLSSCGISNVKYVETISGVVFTVYYRSVMAIYEAVAFIDSKRDSKRNKTVTQLQFSSRSAIPTYSLEEINSGIKKMYQAELKDFLLSSVQKIQKNKYKLSYVNSKGVKYQSVIAKQPFSEVEQLKKVQNPIDMEDVLAYIFSLYQDIKPMDFQVKSAPYFSSNSSQGLYAIIFGEKIQIKITYEKGVFDLLSYKNIQIQLESEKTIQQQNSQIESQKYKSFENLTDPIFIEVWKYFISQYPKYEEFDIITVEYQSLNGTNFLISMKSPKNIIGQQNVKTLIYHSTSGLIKVVQLQVDGQTINLEVEDYYHQESAKQLQQKVSQQDITEIKSYNYKSDLEFAETYRFMLDTLKIANIIPIVQVRRFQSTDKIDFEIIYSDKEKVIIRKFKENKRNNLRSNVSDKKKFQVVQYNAKRSNSVPMMKLQNNNSQQIASFLQLQKPQLFKTYIIESYIEINKSHHNVKLLTPTGSYVTQVLADQQKDLHLTSLIQSSNSTCYDFPTQKLKQTIDLQKIDEFLKSRYTGLVTASIQVFQAQIDDDKKKYRVLYKDEDGRKVDFLVQNFNGQLVVVQSLVLEDGYVNVQPNDQMTKDAQLTAKAHFSEFLNNCQITLRLTNQTHSQLIFSCPITAYQYIYSTKTMTDKLQVIYQSTEQQNHLQVHNKSNIMNLKQIIKDRTFIDIDSIVRQRFSEYVRTNHVTDVERQELIGPSGHTYTSYKLYYKSTLGYYICEASHFAEEINIVKFYLSPLPSNKNCQVLDQSTGECIQCLPKYKLEFGKCHQRIQSCLSQVGDVCVQCDSRSVMKEGKCMSNCEDVFVLRKLRISGESK